MPILQDYPPLCARCFEQIVDTDGSICGTCADDLRDRAKESEAMNDHDEGETEAC